ncbi:MAG: protein kinase, partial [Polyangiaceae bacterium]|nr:protein kinase [Polyangiaceae bacterium]
RMSMEHRQWVMRHVAYALAYIHGAGLVHRDIKLPNVLVTRHFWEEPTQAAHIKLVDLGVAAPVGNPRPLTDIGGLIGTAAYVAPELVLLRQRGERSAHPAGDVFAFGTMGWRLMTSQHPTGLPPSSSFWDYVRYYQGASTGQNPFPVGQVEGLWGNVLRRCLTLDVEQRLATGSHIVAAIEGAAMPPVPTGYGYSSSMPPNAPRERLSGQMTSPQAQLASSGSFNRSASGYLTTPPPPPGPSNNPPAAPPWYIWVIGLIALGAISFVATFFVSNTLKVKPTVPSVPVDTASGSPSAEPPPTPVDSGNTPPAPACASPCCGGIGCETAPQNTTPYASGETGCKAGEPHCPVCPSGRSCVPQACSERIDLKQRWLLRIGEVVPTPPRFMPSPPPLAKIPFAEVCLRLTGARSYTCTRVNAMPYGYDTRLEVTTDDLINRGLDILVRDGAQSPPQALIGRDGAKLQSGAPDATALCRGVMLPPLHGGGPVQSVLVYLDDATATPLERRSENAPLAEARGSQFQVKRRAKPAPVEGGRAPFVYVRTEGGAQPQRGLGFAVRSLPFPREKAGIYCPRLESGVRSLALTSRRGEASAARA